MNEDDIRAIFNNIKLHCIHVSSPPSQVSAPQRAKIIHRKLRYEHFLNLTFFNSLPIIFSLLIFSKNGVSISRGDTRISCSFIPFINLLMLCLLLCLKTHSGRWRVVSSDIKVESLLNSHTRLSPPSLVSRLWSGFPPVIRSQACASCSKTATGDWQPTTGFMAVVSGGRQVSPMDDCQRDFTLPSCALTHTVLSLPAD